MPVSSIGLHISENLIDRICINLSKVHYRYIYRTNIIIPQPTGRVQTELFLFINKWCYKCKSYLFVNVPRLYILHEHGNQQLLMLLLPVSLICATECICGGQSGTEAGFSLHISLCPYWYHSAKIPYLFIYCWRNIISAIHSASLTHL